MNHDLVKDAVTRVMKNAERQLCADIGEIGPEREARFKKLVTEGLAVLQANLLDLGVGIDLGNVQIERRA